MPWCHWLTCPSPLLQMSEIVSRRKPSPNGSTSTLSRYGHRQSSGHHCPSSPRPQTPKHPQPQPRVLVRPRTWQWRVPGAGAGASVPHLWLRPLSCFHGGSLPSQAGSALLLPSHVCQEGMVPLARGDVSCALTPSVLSHSCRCPFPVNVLGPWPRAEPQLGTRHTLGHAPPPAPMCLHMSLTPQCHRGATTLCPSWVPSLLSPNCSLLSALRSTGEQR